MKRNIVIDASATGCWLFDEEESNFSEKVFSDVFSGGIRLIQPYIWSYEVTNMIRNAVMVKNRIKEEEGKRLLFLWKSVPVDYEEHEESNEYEILGCALKNQLSAYDAAYFNLAEKRGIELATEDSDLLKLKETYPWIKRLRECL